MDKEYSSKVWAVFSKAGNIREEKKHDFNMGITLFAACQILIDYYCFPILWKLVVCLVSQFVMEIS